ncbi:hypothetical protein ACM9HB_35745, partial [Streptomyces sp. JAC128]|uniref:hypothetical protein n=1 Tax=Streptomyces sp. JAC128 TaxID=3418412 RepID=UPI003D81318E
KEHVVRNGGKRTRNEMFGLARKELGKRQDEGEDEEEEGVQKKPGKEKRSQGGGGEKRARFAGLAFPDQIVTELLGRELM